MDLCVSSLGRPLLGGRLGEGLMAGCPPGRFDALVRMARVDGYGVSRSDVGDGEFEPETFGRGQAPRRCGRTPRLPAPGPGGR